MPATEQVRDEAPGTVTGYCLLVEGDLMPPSGQHTYTPLLTIVYAYQYDPRDSWGPGELPPGAPVASTSSDFGGCFSVLLPPGEYVMCILWKGQTYCRARVTVFSGEVAETDLLVYGAVAN